MIVAPSISSIGSNTQVIQPVGGGFDFISQLPIDVSRIIFAIARKNLIEIAQVCKAWKQLAYDGGLHNRIAPALSLRCGEAVWKQYIGDPGKEPPLPLCIFRDDLEEICQDLVMGTGWLTLVPEKVIVTDKDGTKKVVLINADNMGVLVKTPKAGYPTGYDETARTESINEYRPAHKMHWVWIRIKPTGRDKLFSAQVSGFLDTIVTMFMEKIRTGNNCLDRARGMPTWVRVKEQEQYLRIYLGFVGANLDVRGLTLWESSSVVVAVARKSLEQRTIFV